MDTISKEHRSWNMSRIGNKDTLPEKLVRSFLHRAGFRFRLHVKTLPGNPDIVLPKYGFAIFVHGCFWHRHKGCRYTYMPKSRIEFWKEKFQENVERDKQKKKKLEDSGWRVVTMWECEAKESDKLVASLSELTALKRVKK